MTVDNMIGKNFDTLAQRMIYVYLGTFPKFVPVPSDDAGEEAQRQMHAFLEEMLHKIYADPSLLDLPLDPDDYYRPGEMMKGKPELIKAMRKINKSIIALYTLLQMLGEVGEIVGNTLRIEKSACRVTAKTLAQLEQFGIHSNNEKTAVVLWSDDYPDIAPAWKLLSAITNQYSQTLQFPYQGDGILVFIHGIFNTEYPHLSESFARLLGSEKEFQALEAFLQQQGYRRVGREVFRPGGSPDLQIELSWYKPFNGKDGGCLNVGMNFSRKDQLLLGLKIPRFRELVTHFDEMDDKLKDMVIACTKPCNDCGYCIQTDKTRRQIMAFTADHQGATHRLCPFFPNLSWNRLDDATAAGMVQLLQFAEITFGS